MILNEELETMELQSLDESKRSGHHGSSTTAIAS